MPDPRGERYSLSFANAAGTAGEPLSGAVQLDLLEVDAHYWFALDLGADGFVAIRHDDVPLPRGSLLEVRADGLWAEMVCEVAGEHWTFGLEAFALLLEDREEARTATVGARVPVGYDLEWDTGRVDGELLIGGRTTRRIGCSGVGDFDHLSGDLPTIDWPRWINRLGA
jgi:hypothetical protein